MSVARYLCDASRPLHAAVDPSVVLQAGVVEVEGLVPLSIALLVGAVFDVGPG